MNMLAIVAKYDDQNGRGGIAKVAKMVNTKPAYLSQIKNRSDERGMGDAIARRFEEVFELGHGGMDRLRASGDYRDTELLGAEEIELIRLFRALSTQQKLAVLGIVRQIPPDKKNSEGGG
jgi:hypothetical protein